jgi:hypothetical protein
MAISYPLTLPTITGIAQFTLRAVTSDEVAISPFSFAQQVQLNQGEMWEADVGLPVLTRAQADVWEAFFLSLRGSYGTFLLGDPEHAEARGVLGGAPLVASSGATGTSLDVSGCSANVTGWALAGDFLQLGDGGTARLHRLLENVDTDASGNATLRFWPSIRSSPAVGAPVVMTGAKGLFRLKGRTPDFRRVPLFTSISFTCMEALNGL